jgi:hypothetical protein
MKSRFLAAGVAFVSVLVVGCGGGASTRQPASKDMFKIADRIERSVTKLEPYATTPPPQALCLPASPTAYICELKWNRPVAGVTRPRSKHLSLDVAVNGDATKFSTGAKSPGWVRLSQ